MSERLNQLFTVCGAYLGSFPSYYFGIHGVPQSDNTMHGWHRSVIPVAGTLAYLHVRMYTGRGSWTPDYLEAGKTKRFRVYKNGSSTSLTLTLGDGETYEGYDDTHTVTVSPGDYFYIKCSEIGGNAYAYAYITLVFFPTNIFETALLGQGSSGRTTINAGACTMSGGGVTGDQGTTIARECVLRDFWAYGNASTCTVYKNGEPTELAITKGSGLASNLVNTVECSPGDVVWIVSTSGSNSFGVKRVDTGYMSFLAGGAPGDLDVWFNTPRREGIVNGCTTHNLSSGTLMNSGVIRNLYVTLQAAPGAGKSWTFTIAKLSEGEFVDTDLEVVISGSDTEGHDDGHWIYVEKGDVVAIKTNRSGSPSYQGYAWGCDILGTVELNLPTVETLPCSERTPTSATANGNILTLGGYYVTTRGFCYKKGTTGDPTVDDSTVSEDGEFIEGPYSLSITDFESEEDYRVRAYATGPKGTAYGETVTCAVLVFPTDNMARVSAIRRIFRPGLYRMELALGDLGFEWDVSEVAMRKTEEGVAEPEEEKPSEPPTKEEIEKARQRFQEESWPKAMESLEMMFPERPPVSGKYTPPAPRPKITYTNPVTGEPLKPSTTDKPTPKPFIPFISPTEEDKE